MIYDSGSNETRSGLKRAETERHRARRNGLLAAILIATGLFLLAELLYACLHGPLDSIRSFALFDAPLLVIDAALVGYTFGRLD